MDTRIVRTDQDDAADGLTASSDEDGDHVVIRTNGTEIEVEALEGEWRWRWPDGNSIVGTIGATDSGTPMPEHPSMVFEGDDPASVLNQLEAIVEEIDDHEHWIKLWARFPLRLLSLRSTHSTWSWWRPGGCRSKWYGRLRAGTATFISVYT